MLSPTLPEFLDAGSAFGDCIPVADVLRSCPTGEAGLDQAYASLGAAFTINHDHALPEKRAVPYLMAGDAIAFRLLDEAARSGNDAQAPYPQLHCFLAHANDTY